MKSADDINTDRWDMIIRPQTGWFNVDFSGLWRCRDLILLFVRRDFVALYKQTVLGPAWFLLQPLLSTLVFTVIFGQIARIPTDGLPPFLFYMLGTVIWSYFANCLTRTSTTFINNAYIFGKVYFPRLAVPISVVITNLLTFAVQFGLFLAFLLFFYLKGSDIKPNLWVLIIPFLLVQMAALGFGAGILISALTTKYRDLNLAMTFGVQLWMYATPIVYPMSQIPEKWQWLYALNPMAVIVEIFRYALLGAGSVKPWYLGLSFSVTSVLIVIGILLFSRVEKTFMDTV